MSLFDWFKTRSASKEQTLTQYAPFDIANIMVDGTTALNCPPYMSAITLLSTSLAKLGKHAMKDGKRLKGHPIEKLLSEPNPFIDGYTMFLQAETHRINDGNAYLQIIRDKQGDPINLLPIDPSNVTMNMNSDGFYYKTSNGQVVPPVDMIHVRAPHLDSEMKGIGYHTILREQLKLWLAAQKHQSEYFELGAFPRALLESDEPLSEDAKRVVRQEWQRGMTEQQSKLKIAVVDSRMNYKPLAVSFSDMELNTMYSELTKQIASAFNLSPTLIAHDGSRNTYTNLETQNMQFIQNALMQGITAWEQQLKKLFADNEMYIRINIDTLLRADSTSRAERLKTLVEANIMTIDEAREYEGLKAL